MNAEQILEILISAGIVPELDKVAITHNNSHISVNNPDPLTTQEWKDISQDVVNALFIHGLPYSVDLVGPTGFELWSIE